MENLPRFPVSDSSKYSEKKLLRYLALALALAATSAHAADATWGSNTTGNWSVGSNWTSSAAPGQLTSSGTSTPDTAFFNNAAGASLITIDSPWNIKSMTFAVLNTGGVFTSPGAYTIGSTGGNAITLTTGGVISIGPSGTNTSVPIGTVVNVSTSQTINAPLILGNAGGQTYTFTNSSTSATGILNFGGAIRSSGSSGTTTLTTTGTGRINISGNITDSGSGTALALDANVSANVLVNLTGTNTFSGTLTQRSGNLRGIDGVGFSPNANIFVAGSGSNNNSIETNGNFTRAFGSGAGQISFASGTNFAFSAVGGDLVIALGGLATPTPIVLGNTNMTYGNMWLNGSANTTGKITVMNAINLNSHNLTLGGQGGLSTTRGTVAGVISGVGTGVVGTTALNIGGITSWIQLTGANTFDGPIRVGENSTLYVNSLGNWVASNTTASNLGSPTSAANGIIHLGNSSTGSGMLVYQGTGETTNRQISYEWDNGGIDQEGTGLLKITDFIFHSPNRNNFTLRMNLLGSTTGAGEIAGNITDDNVVGNVNFISVIKSGTGTWTLSGTNTYTKPTQITQGVLQFAKEVSLYNNGAAATWNATNIVVTAGATLGVNIGGTGEFTTADVATLTGFLPSGTFIGLDGTNASGGNFTYGSVLSGSGVGLNVLGGGITLTQANTYTGGTMVSGGTLVVGANAPVSSAGALGNAATNVTLGSANYATAAAILTNGAFTVARNIAEATTPGNSSFTIGGSQTSGTSTYTGAISLTKDTTLTSAAGGEVDFTTGVISGAFSTIIDGGGIVKLTGTNTFGGAGKSVTVQGGTTLFVSSGATGGNTNLGSTSNSLVFNNGTLKFGAAFDPSGRTITFNSGGATFDTNGNTVTFASAVGNSGVGGLTKTGTGSLILSGSNTYTGTTAVALGALVAGANVPSSGAGAFGNASSAISLGSASLSGSASILTNGVFTIARDITEVGSPTNSSLVIGGSNASGTAAYTGNIALTGATTLNAVTGGEVDFTTGVISGSANVIVDGGGTVKLTGTNTFGGAGKSVTLQGGTKLNLSANANLGDSSNALTINNGTLQFNTAFDPSSRTITFNSGGATVDIGANTVTFANAVGNGGTGGLTKTGGGLLILSGSNNYSGNTVLSSGILRATDGTGLPSASAFTIGADFETSANFVRSLGTSAGQVNFTPGSNVSFNAVGGNVVVALGGLSTPTQLTWGANFNVASLFLNSSRNETGTVDFRNPINFNGQSPVLGTISSDATTTLATFSGVLSGTATSIRIGLNSGNIAFTGANTFDAPIVIGAGLTEFLHVHTVGNWVAANSTPSNMGSPTTSANGLLTLGSNASGGGGLVYEGVGETSNRSINIGWSPAVIDQSGTGLLKFTGNVQAFSTSTTQHYNLNLIGSTTGNGELSGNIANDTQVGNSTKLGITKTGTNTWTLSGTNTYTDPTTINGGMLQFAKEVSLYNNGAAAAWSSSNIIVTSGTLGLNVGGTGEFTSSDVSTLSALSSLASGSFVGLDTTNATGGNFSATGTIAGSGVGLTKLGVNNLTLSGTNTYTGVTTVTQGSLILGANAPSGSAGALGNASSTVSLGSATFTGAAGLLTNGAFTVARNISEIASPTNTSFTIGGNQSSGTSAYTGNIALTKATTLTAATGGEVDFTTGVISGAFDTTIDGGGIVKLTGTNTFGSGKTMTIQSATTLFASASANLGNSTNALTFNSGTLKFGGAFDPSSHTLTFSSGGATFDTNGNAVTFANAVGNGGSGSLTKTGSNTLTLSAANSYSGGTVVSGGTVALSGSGTFGSGSVTAAGGTVDLGTKSITNTLGALTSGGTVQNGTITNNSGNYDLQNGTVSAVLNGSNGLNKTTSNTVTVSGSNGYTGGTTVTLGTLVVGNSSGLGTGTVGIASGGTVSNGTGSTYAFTNNVTNNGTITSSNNVTFASGKTLNGSGTLTGGGTYTVNGFLSPGNSPGTVTVGASTTLTLTTGTTTIWQLNSISSPVAGTNYDTFSLDPTAIVNVNGTLQIDLIGGVVFSTDPYWETSHSYTLFSGGGTVSGSFTGLTNDYTYTNADGTGTFGYTSGSNNLTYTWVAVPEPQTWALAALGVSAVLFRLRRKMRGE